MIKPAATKTIFSEQVKLILMSSSNQAQERLYLLEWKILITNAHMCIKICTII